jgi:hypothetical protein
VVDIQLGAQVVSAPPERKYEYLGSEPECLYILRSPGIDSQPGGIDFLESIPGLLKKCTKSGSGMHKKGDIRATKKNIFLIIKIYKIN